MRVGSGLLIVLMFPVAVCAQDRPRTTLAEVVDAAVANNPDIAAAQQRYEAARQRPVQERSLSDPMVSAGYSSGGRPWPGAGLGAEPTANIGFLVSQAVPYPGKRGLRAAVASREADAEFQQIDAARLRIIAQVKQAYYRLAYADAVSKVLRLRAASLEARRGSRDRAARAVLRRPDASGLQVGQTRRRARLRHAARAGLRRRRRRPGGH
jgi:outer membrane protein TolC